MIRIDEIYNNIFHAWLQSLRLNARIFYCDPFGSSAPENLMNYNLPVDTESADFILMHDQEPVHPDIHAPLFESFVRRNSDIAGRHARSGKIITSEYDSEFVDQLTSMYGFESYYYFFHGWAALDWYRGYDKTFLIAKPRHRTPKKAFFSPNRIIGGKRDHRILFLYHILKNNLTNNYVSAPKVCPAEDISIADLASKFKDQYPDIVETFNSAGLPLLFDNEETQVMSSYFITNFNECQDSLFYVPTETVFAGRRKHLTEKTFKPIALGMPFILVAAAGSLEYLRMYGFKTFADVIDESYDEELDGFARIEKVTKLLREIDSLSDNEKQQIHKHCLPAVEHNMNHFYKGDFEKALTNELLAMLGNLGQSLGKVPKDTT